MSYLGSEVESKDIVDGDDSTCVESANDGAMEILAETVKQFGSYSAASVGACAWVDSGKVTGKPQVSPKDLVLYTSKLGPAKGRVVGLGIKKPSGTIEDLVRIDMDNSGKGIHFNAKYRKDTSSKLAAVLTPTVGLKPNDREILYFQYLKGIENRSAEFIWAWWSTGKAN